MKYSHRALSLPVQQNTSEDDGDCSYGEAKASHWFRGIYLVSFLSLF